MRRQLLALVAVGAVGLTAGCGFLLGLESLTYTASPVNVSDQALNQTDYRETAVLTQNETIPVTAFGQTRTVKVTNHIAKYRQGSDAGGMTADGPALFIALASPEIEVLGNTINPIGDVPNDEIVERTDTLYENVSVGEEQGTRTVEALGASRQIQTWEATAVMRGVRVPVYVDATRFKHGSDYLVAIAIYPRHEVGERAMVDRLVAGLQHSDDDGDIAGATEQDRRLN
ncbi:MAG: DUF6517 family protein [Halorientalis sp.]